MFLPATDARATPIAMRKLDRAELSVFEDRGLIDDNQVPGRKCLLVVDPEDEWDFGSL